MFLYFLGNLSEIKTKLRTLNWKTYYVNGQYLCILLNRCVLNFSAFLIVNSESTTFGIWHSLLCRRHNWLALTWKIYFVSAGVAGTISQLQAPIELALTWPNNLWLMRQTVNKPMGGWIIGTLWIRNKKDPKLPFSFTFQVFVIKNLIELLLFRHSLMGFQSK